MAARKDERWVGPMAVSWAELSEAGVVLALVI